MQVTLERSYEPDIAIGGVSGSRYLRCFRPENSKNYYFRLLWLMKIATNAIFALYDGQGNPNPWSEDIAGQLLCISACATASCARLDFTAHRSFVRRRSPHRQTGGGGRAPSPPSPSYSTFCPTRG